MAPKTLLAVNEYVVVAVGDTAMVPLEPTEPIPVIKTEVALVTYHCKVAEPPALMVDGETLKISTNGALYG